MPRARNIKHSFFQDDQIAEMEPIERLFFIGLWTLADFRGVVEYRPKMIKAQLLPYEDGISTEKIGTTLERLGFVRFYVNGGRIFAKIRNFERHQNPHKNERDAGSRLPEETDEGSQAIELKDFFKKPEKIGTKPEKIGTARADSGLLITDSGLLSADSCLLQPEPSNHLTSGITSPQVETSFCEGGLKNEKQEKSARTRLNTDTWNAYAVAYFSRYKTDPVRNAKTNGQIAQLTLRLGEESPAVASWFVRASNNSWYLQKAHSLDCLLKDCEAIRTQWATNKPITAEQARLKDKGAGGAIGRLFAESGLPSLEDDQERF